MPYISELLNKKVTDSSDSVVGKLEDILIYPKEGSFAPLEFLMVRTSPEKKLTFVPYQYVENVSDTKITLKTLFNKIPPVDPQLSNYIFLKRDVLDKQIVDVAGTRVVRVNDLRIGNFENRICVLAIDASFRGLLRRLGLQETFLAKPFKVKLIDWRQAQLLGSGSGPVQLNTVAENLSSLHPADLANIVEELDIKQGSTILESLDEAEAAKVLEELEPNLQSVLVKYLGPEKAAKILARMSSDEIVDFVKTLSSEEAKNLLAKVNGGKAKNIVQLMSYPDATAGGLMTADYVRVLPEWTVAQTVEEVKKLSPSMRSILFVYVVSEDGKFQGVVSLRRLLISSPDTTIKKLIKTIPAISTLKPHDGIRKIIRLMTKYNLYAAVVLDRDKKLLGVVTIDDVLRQLYPYA